MNDTKKRILIVDDCADDIHLLMENLKSEYAVLAATSGEKAIELSKKAPKPDIVLLDVEMPNMNGYEVCKRIKSDPETHSISVIFVSAHDTVEEKLAGYESGGLDYLIKPVQPKELLQKVKLAIQNRDELEKTEALKQQATSTALMAISNAGEQGVLLDFMRRSYYISEFSELAQIVASACLNYDLDCCVQIRASREIASVGSKGTVTPLEEELLLRLKDTGRIKETGPRLVSNFGDVSLLVKNMPDDEDKRGRLRDHLALLLEAAEGRAASLEMEKRLARILRESNNTVRELQNLHSKQASDSIEIMDSVRLDLEGAFSECVLTESQESMLLEIVQGGVEKLLVNQDTSDDVGTKLEKALSRMVLELNEP